ncbi:MAG TPA: type II TA system antitoxin MqsA family protein [Oscillospiraceae bacterium]|nr:type II TA system antitoxin MqsA family protein [Oscillospiraceae bacterium]
MMSKVCPECLNEAETEIKEKNEQYVVKGQEFIIKAKIKCCKTCGAELWDDELDSNNLLTAYNLYRETNGLLFPEEIKSIRLKYGLTQSSFAKILGFGEKTITRYENGALQDMAQNNLILLMQNTANFLELWNRNKNVLQSTEIKKVEKLLNSVCKISEIKIKVPMRFPSMNCASRIKNFDNNVRYTSCMQSSYALQQ